MDAAQEQPSFQGTQIGCGNEQRNFFAPVTQKLFSAGLERLRDACFDPTSLARDLDLARFTGREWLIKRIDLFIAERPRGYVIVQAEAGVGKSTLAAHLVGTRPWLHHFTRLPGGRSSEAARRSLCAQLIARWDLAREWAPGGCLPSAAGRPDWLGRLLDAAARTRDEREPGTPIVLVIDGLDEADPDPASRGRGLPLGLPTSLPDGTYVVATSRFGVDRALHAVRNPADWLEIVVDGPDNLDDMRRFLQDATDPVGGDSRLLAALRREGVDANWFRSAAAESCDGVWIYLRYVLDDIRDGGTSAREVAGLPGDLAGYYGEQLQQWRGPHDDEAAARRWEQVRLPLLGVLAVARAPLVVPELAALAGVHEGAARAFAEETARAFLSRDADPSGEPRYALRHQSLRDLITGDVPANRPDLASLASMLAGEARLAHERITTALTPSGAAGGRDWRSARRYTRLHLAAHAAASGALDSLVCDPGFLLVADPASVLGNRAYLLTAAGKRAMAAFDLTLDHWVRSADEEKLRGLALNAARVRASELVAACRECSDSEWPVLWAAWPGQGHRTLSSHDGVVRALAIGQVGGRDVIISGGDDQIVQIWDAVDGTPLGPPLAGHTDTVTSVAISRADDRDVIIGGALDGTVLAWDALTHAPARRPLSGYGGRTGVRAMGRAGERDVIIAGGGSKGWLQVWDAVTELPVTVLLSELDDLADSVTIGRAGDRDVIVAGSEDGTVRAWDAVTGSAAIPPRNLSSEDYYALTALAVGQSDGRSLIACGYQRGRTDEDPEFSIGTVQTWDSATGEPVATLLAHDASPISAVAIGRAGGRDIVAAGTSYGTILIWDAVPLDQPASPDSAHEGPVTAVAIGRAGNRDVIASVASDGTVRAWDAVTGVQVLTPRHHWGSPATSVAIGRAGNRDLIVSGDEDGNLVIQDAVTGEQPWPSVGHRDWVASVAIGRAGNDDAIISGSGDGTVRIWRPTGDRLRQARLTTPGCVTSVAIGRAGDCHVIVAGCEGGTIGAWDAATGEDIFPSVRQGTYVYAVAIGRAGDRNVIVSCTNNGTMILDAVTGAVIGGVRGLLSSAQSAAIGRAGDKEVIVAGFPGGEVRVYDVATDTATSPPLYCHDDVVNAVVIGQVGGRTVIASCSSDCSVVVHEYRPRRPLRVLQILPRSAARHAGNYRTPPG